MSKILLFDFDGTIADSLESFIEIVGELAMKYKLPKRSREELEALRSEEPKVIIKRLKIPFYKIPLMARDMKKMQQKHIPTMRSFSTLPAVLQALKKNGYRLGILTSNGRENVELFLKNNDIELFEFIYSDSSIFGKDKAIRNFLKDYAVKKEDAFYIGDEIRDIQACQKVGIKIIAVSWGLNTKDGLITHHPDFLIDTPKQLLELLHGDSAFKE